MDQVMLLLVYIKYVNILRLKYSFLCKLMVVLCIYSWNNIFCSMYLFWWSIHVCNCFNSDRNLNNGWKATTWCSEDDTKQSQRFWKRSYCYNIIEQCLFTVRDYIWRIWGAKIWGQLYETETSELLFLLHLFYVTVVTFFSTSIFLFSGCFYTIRPTHTKCIHSRV
jgi:hypothetical protein